MPLVTSGQFAYVYKLNSEAGDDLAVRCFRGYLQDRDQRYKAIQDHLTNHSLPFLSGVTYEPAGILVEGQRFPILFMKWIEGPTLDLYLDQMVTRKDVILHLAQEWVKLVAALRNAGLAHGDLQHGNIIVERGRLRLVDHDGMFTPEMTGWSSSELGHQHYQHPHRDERLFNAELDNFSALVIYLSLISLAERPSLWERYHDENLLFTKSDFIDPEASSLFAEIRELGGEPLRLAEILRTAAKSSPADVPFLADLVSVTSRLPMWMTAPVAMESKTKTREVVLPELPRHGNPSRWKPWKPRESASRMPATTPSSTYQTIFSGPATGPPAAGTGSGGIAPSSVTMTPAEIRDPDEVFLNTVYFAKEFLRRTFIWWYWGIYLCFQFLGLDLTAALILAVLCLVLGSLVFGLVRALELSKNAPKTLPSTRSQRASLPPRNGSVPPPQKLPVTQMTPLSITGTEPIIGNSKLSIYHLNSCGWVERISPRNRVGFSSPSAAVADGYKPCRVCAVT